jgi:CCR4-NOT transcriptional complex subunit CAF120
MTGTPLIDLAHTKKKPQEASSEGLTAYIDHREKEKANAKANHSTAAMQAEIDRRMMAAQQRQMMEMQQMGQGPHMSPQLHMPGGYPTPTPQGYPPALAYSSTDQLHMYQQPGYFPQQAVSPMVAPGMQPGWGTPSPQPMQGPYFAAPQQQQSPQMQPRFAASQQQQQQQPYTQPYGASFDQAQAAARFAHQNRG